MLRTRGDAWETSVTGSLQHIEAVIVEIEAVIVENEHLPWDNMAVVKVQSSPRFG